MKLFLRQLLIGLFIIPISAWAAVPPKVDVVIVGAGLSGLAAAHALKKAGISYEVLELTPRVGGRVRTVRYEREGEPTLAADSGMEEYWESNPAVELLRELKLPLRKDVAASSIVLNGRLEKLGENEDSITFQKRIFGEAELKALEGFKSKVSPLVDRLKKAPPIPSNLLPLKSISFAQWVGDQKLPTRVADWVRISVECEIGTPWNRISALDGIAEFHIFLGKGEDSYRVVGGNEKFTNALATSVGGDHIALNKRVTRITTHGDRVRISYLDMATNQNGEIQAKEVISTIPLFRLFEVAFDPPLSNHKREAILSQTYGAYFKVHLFVPASAKKFWTVPGSGSILPILSDSNLGVIYEGNPDQDAKTKIISLLVFGDYADAFNMTPLDQVRVAIKDQFEKMWPGFSKEILGMEFYRFHPRAIAAWPPGRSRFDELSEEIRKPEHHVHLAGDFTESSHSDGAFISAERAVRQILRARKGAR